MKISTMYLLLIIGWFVAALPINVIAFVFATQESKKEHTDNEKILIGIAQVISALISVGMLIYLLGII